jgi:hypothetical protein
MYIQIHRAIHPLGSPLVREKRNSDEKHKYTSRYWRCSNNTAIERWKVVRWGGNEMLHLGALTTETSSKGEILGLDGDTYKWEQSQRESQR